jgi:hypothetical protein
MSDLSARESALAKILNLSRVVEPDEDPEADPEVVLQEKERLIKMTANAHIVICFI